MTIVKINDFPTYLKGFLLTQFRDSPFLQAMIEALGIEFQLMEDTIYDLTYKRSIRTAIGAQLDGLGTIVNEPRSGRDDETYRSALLLRIFINVSNGTPEDLIHILKVLTAASRVRIFELFPAASFQLFSDGKTIPASILDTIQQTSPAAVSNVPIIISLGESPYFIFGFDPDIQPLYFHTADITINNIGIGLTAAEILAFGSGIPSSFGSQFTITNDSVNPAYLCTPLLKNGIPLRDYLALSLSGGGVFGLSDGSSLYVGPLTGLALENFPWYVFSGSNTRNPEGEGFAEVGFMQLTFADGSLFSFADGGLMNVIEREGQIIEGYELSDTNFPPLEMADNTFFNTDDGSNLSLFETWAQYNVNYAGKLCEAIQREGFSPIPLKLAARYDLKA